MATKNKILLAEDDHALSNAYNNGLTQAGFDVVLATDGKEAIEKIKSEKPDLVLLDIMMPNKNGFEVLEEIKKDDSLQSISVIILSNLGQESDINKGKELGALDHLVKSDLSMQELVEKVKYYLAGKAERKP